MEILEILIYVFSIILAIIGTYYAIIAYKKQKPVYIKENFQIINNNINSFPNLEITYEDNPIENLSSTNIIFWNAGNQRIDKKIDIPENTSLFIQAKKGIKILSASIISRTKYENAFQVKLSDNQVLCNFDYLSKNDGVKIQIIHTGSSINDLLFSGTIKDIGEPVDITQKIKSQSFRFVLIVVGIIGIVSGIIYSRLTSYLISYFNILKEGNLYGIVLVIPIFFMIIFFMLTLIPIRSFILKFYYQKVPEQLQ